MPPTAIGVRPSWIRVKRLNDGVRSRIAASVGTTATVCQAANCPNIGQCWARGTATYMIMGHVCTRNCAFCDVDFGRPDPLDPAEPARIAASVEGLGLKYVVMTCVDRDDLADSGAAHWVATIESIRASRGELVLASGTQFVAGAIERVGDVFGARYLAGTGIEILTGDFKGDEPSIRAVARSRPEVFAHNVETTPRLQKVARHKANWERSVRVLQTARAVAAEIGHTMFIKSGMMLGLGEGDAEVREAMDILRESGVELLTLGQYLKPRNVAGKLDMTRWVTPDEFTALAEYGRSIGFAGVAASPLTRSSYLAETLYAQALAARNVGLQTRMRT
ncbi:MAG: radical SAM protein [bacterium]|nr:radical SAM protein [bacterium]